MGSGGDILSSLNFKLGHYPNARYAPKADI
jgi:hypothetical protein